MNHLLAIIRKKPPFFWGVTAAYLILLGFLRWQLRPTIDLVWFLIGGFLGTILLDAAEEFFRLNPSPFRSIVFVWAFVAVAFFVITSSDVYIGKGVVLSLYLTLMLWQLGEWQTRHDLTSWYRMVAGSVRQSAQKWGLVIFCGLFVVVSYLFVR